MQALLRFEMRYCRPYVLVQWTGSDASGDAREPLDRPTICEAITAFERTIGHSLP